MKALPIALILVLTFALVATADAARYPFGFKGGITWAEWSGDAPEGVETRNAFMAGTFVEFPLSSTISFQPELFYVGKGARVVLPDVFPRDVTDYKLYYADVPLLARINWVFGASEPYLIIGPSVNFLVSAKMDFDHSSVDISDQYSSVEFSFVAGFGLNMKSMVLEGRYSKGMADANEAGGIKNDVAALQFGIKF